MVVASRKTCVGCRVSLDADKFSRDISRADRLQNRCKPCNSTRLKARRLVIKNRGSK